jgi:hypothetical protein
LGRLEASTVQVDYSPGMGCIVVLLNVAAWLVY